MEPFKASICIANMDSLTYDPQRLTISINRENSIYVKSIVKKYENLGKRNLENYKRTINI